MKTLKIKDIEQIVKDKDRLVSVEIEGSKIDVKQYLSIVDKINLVESCLLSGLNDETGSINKNSIEMAKVIFITKFYTNIRTSKDNIKMYDLLVNSGVYSEILKSIPKSELENIELLLKNQIEDHDKEYAKDNSLEKIVERGMSDLKGILMNIGSEIPNETNTIEIAEQVKNTLKDANPDNLKFINDFIEAADKDSKN